MNSHPLTRARLAALVAIACFGILGTTTQTQAQEELPDDVREKILDRLEALTVQVEKKSMGRFSAASAAFEKASASSSAASAFYFECCKVVDFQRQGKSFSDFRKWQERNREAIRSTEFERVLQIQLKLLMLTIRYINMEDKTQIIDPLESYLAAVVSAEKSIDGENRQNLNEDVSRSVFAQTYSFDKALGELGNWELQPLNLRGHYQKTILPIVRENGTTGAIESAWDRLIKLEATLVSNRKNESHEEEFKKVAHPALQWAKWADVADHGGRAKAAAAMLSLIENNLGHSDAQKWILDLEDVANGRRLGELE